MRYQVASERHRVVLPRTARAFDRLSGRPVFLKTGRRAAVLAECSALLMLPAGIAPEPIDVCSTDDPETLCLVTGWLEGCSLLEAGPSIDAVRLPVIVLSICRALIHLHRLGIVHADLKPANVFLDETHSRAWLLDFESAHSWERPAFAVEAGESATTWRYAAPELIRGWAVDFRADLYALGMTLRHVRPDMPSDALWRPVLDRLTEPSPSRRYPHAAALRDDISRRFGIPIEPAVPEPMAGSLRGRTEELRSVLAWAKDSAGSRVLFVQSRPGAGLTRFLMESQLALLRAGHACICTIDFSRSGAALGTDRATRGVEFAAECLERGERILTGLPIPSPSLRWPGSPVPEGLRLLADEARPRRLNLSPLRAESLSEMVSAACGRAGPSVDALVRMLDTRTEGDLRAFAEGFETMARSAPREDGIEWRVQELLSTPTWRGEIPPAWDDIPEALRRPLQIVARIGTAFPEATARELLDRHGEVGAFDRLIDFGLVLADGGSGAVRFVHRPLRETAMGLPLADARVIDEWLNATLEPGPADTEQVLEAVRRARTLADRRREGSLLGRALDDAWREYRVSDLRDLLLSPCGETWSKETAKAMAREMECRIGGDWSAARVLRVAGEVFLQSGDPRAVPLLEAAAEDARTPEGLQSLLLLAYCDALAMRVEDCKARLARIDRLEASGYDPIPGLIDFDRARCALYLGDRPEAERRGRIAVEKLAGSSRPQEAESLMLLATLYMPDRAEEAIVLVNRAIATAPWLTLRAMGLILRSQIHEFLGDLPAFSSSARAALDALEGRGSQRQMITARRQRAWAWAQLDRARDAEDEAARLLQLPIVRQAKPLLAYTLLLSGYTALQRGEGRVAVGQMSAALVQGAVMPLELQSVLLRYLLDALLDLRAWQTEREYGAQLVLPAGTDDPSVRVVTARALALHAQAEGLGSEARDVLMPHLETARGCRSCLESARFLHHLGVATMDAAEGRTDRATARAAAACFQEALDRFGPVGYGYFRARSLLGLSRSEALAGRRREALSAAGQAVELARRIGARAALADALYLRAELAMSEH